MAELHNLYPEVPAETCTMCNDAGTQQCTTCNGTRYCSAQCQKDDWLTHKLLCKTLKEFEPSMRPDPSHTRAIYFPEDGDRPIFVWAQVLGRDAEGNPLLDGNVLQGNDRALRPSSSVKVNVVLQRRLHNTLKVSACPADHADTVPNQSLAKINKDLARTIRGPILVIGSEGLDDSHNQIDLNTTDFRHFIDYLQARDAMVKFVAETEGTHSSANAVPSVRINCLGDRILHPEHRDEYETTTIPASQLIAPTRFPAPIAERVGLPLIMRAIPAALTWRGRHIKMGDRHVQPRRNLTVESLNPLQGGVPGEQRIGSVIVARQDGKPLLFGHVQALGFYAQSLIMRYEEEVYTTRIDLHTFFEERPSREEFEQFFSMWRERYPDESVRDLISPYDL
ncbi:hypothetical protein K505DRAFT_9872 [Melanomma pulvis-pyrius CBS 109.77]|uniref:MYND-type domain-containing protein n=1 Tax=Melanomma pulvis-pyrius CBS 109.77 TaxID=1314802 RepID=A0A6A6XGR3_9PLEO|nr:hypothetical protein K505DRAFT_9872 [Melanomma pulvis-pyrius CBS 109.77]